MNERRERRPSLFMKKRNVRWLMVTGFQVLGTLACPMGESKSSEFVLATERGKVTHGVRNGLINGIL